MIVREGDLCDNTNDLLYCVLAYTSGSLGLRHEEVNLVQHSNDNPLCPVV